MPAPTTSSVNARPDIAASMEQYPISAAASGAIAYDLFPVIDVDYQAGNYGYIPVNELLTPKTRKRNSNGTYQRTSFEFTDRNYATDEYGGEGVIDERRKNQYADYFDAELVTAEIERFQNVQAAEKRVAAIAMSTTVFSGQTTAAGTAWTDYASSDPIQDVEDAVQAVYDRTGLWPNVAWCSKKTFRNLRNNEKVIDRIEATGAGSPAKASDVTKEMLAQVFDLEEIHVGEMSENTANPGQTPVIASVWDDDKFGVGFVDRSGNMEMPTLFRAFHWSADGSEIGGAIEQYFSDEARADVIRARHDVDEKLELVELGQLITGVA